MDTSRLTQQIQQAAASLGFSACGVSRAEPLDEEARRLEQWLKRGCQGEMAYLADQFDTRVDPRRLLDGARSVISLTYNHFPGDAPPFASRYRISKYALGRDYHEVLKEHLHRLAAVIGAMAGPMASRVCVDSTPIMEKAWAVRSGLGWCGRNTLLITPRAGSFFFLGEIIIDRPLEYDRPRADACGTCRRCLDACPTGALVEPYRLDPRRCLSYLTIESAAPPPEEFSGRFADRIFGCDICQDVCPFNRFARPHHQTDFNPRPDLISMTDNDWRQLTPDRFNHLFAGSAVRRTGYDRLMRTIGFITP